MLDDNSNEIADFSILSFPAIVSTIQALLFLLIEGIIMKNKKTKAINRR